MADTGWVIAGAASDPDNDWNDEDNITASDDARAVSAIANGETGPLVANTFGLSVPTGSTILGVEIRAEAREDLGDNTQITYWNIGESDSVLGTAKTPSTELTGDDANYDVGDATDLWGLSLTSAKVNAATFQVRMKATEDTSEETQVDAMWVKVHYVNNVGASAGAATVSGVLSATAQFAGASTGAGVIAGVLSATAKFAFAVTGAATTLGRLGMKGVIAAAAVVAGVARTYRKSDISYLDGAHVSSVSLVGSHVGTIYLTGKHLSQSDMVGSA